MGGDCAQVIREKRYVCKPLFATITYHLGFNTAKSKSYLGDCVHMAQQCKVQKSLSIVHIISTLNRIRIGMKLLGLSEIASKLQCLFKTLLRTRCEKFPYVRLIFSNILVSFYHRSPGASVKTVVFSVLVSLIPCDLGKQQLCNLILRRTPSFWSACFCYSRWKALDLKKPPFLTPANEIRALA